MTTYFVDPVSGSDAAAGTSFGAAFATTQKGFDTLASGDELRLCQTGVESISAPIDLDGTSGAATGFTDVISYNAAGTTPSDGYKIQAASAIDEMITIHETPDYWRFRGFTLDGNSNAVTGLQNNSSSVDECDYAGWLNVVFENMTGNGCRVSGTAPNYFIGCIARNNGAHGFAAHGNQRGKLRLIGCVSHGNTNSGIVLQYNGDSFAHRCLIYDNGDYGIQAWSSIQILEVFGNTIADNGNHGLFLNGTAGFQTIAHNLIVGNGTGGSGYGIKQNAAGQVIHVHNNNFYGNQDGDSDQVLPGENFSTNPSLDSEYRATVTIEGPSGILIGALAPASGGGSTVIVIDD